MLGLLLHVVIMLYLCISCCDLGLYQILQIRRLWLNIGSHLILLVLSYLNEAILLVHDCDLSLPLHGLLDIIGPALRLQGLVGSYHSSSCFLLLGREISRRPAYGFIHRLCDCSLYEISVRYIQGVGPCMHRLRDLACILQSTTFPFSRLFLFCSSLLLSFSLSL